MENKAFAVWCRAATEKIRYGPDRESVQAELEAHLEDKYDALVAAGMDPDAAAARALDDMGSARELAVQLAAIHRPWLGYLYSTVRLIGIWVAVVAVWLMGINLLWNIESIVSSDRHESLASYTDTGYFGKPNAMVITEGYLLRVPEVGVNRERELLTFQLQAMWLPWMEDLAFWDDFWVRDSNGNIYTFGYDPEYDCWRLRQGGSTGHGGMGAGYRICDYDIFFFDCTAEWIEICYDRDGRDIVLRIDLTGGEAA